MAQSVLLLCRLTELSTWRREVIKISIASAILRGTVITSTKERCVWDSGSAIAPGMETLMGTLDGSQCPVCLLKKFLKLKLKRDFRLKWLMRFMSYICSYTTESKHRWRAFKLKSKSPKWRRQSKKEKKRIKLWKWVSNSTPTWLGSVLITLIINFRQQSSRFLKTITHKSRISARSIKVWLRHLLKCVTKQKRLLFEII